MTDVERARVAEVFETHRRFVEAVAVSAVRGDRAEAADVVQDVAVLLCRHLASLRHPAALRSWLYRMTVNVARDRGSAKGKRTAAIERFAATVEDVIVDPDAVVEAREQRDVVTRTLRNLPTPDRQVLRRRFGLGRQAARGPAPLTQVAEDLGYSKTRIHQIERRALETARRRLWPRDRDDAD